jgi:hypothetical protein
MIGMTPSMNAGSLSFAPLLKVRFVRLCAPFVVDPEHKAARRLEEPSYRPGTSPKYVRTAWYRDGVMLLADVRGGGAEGDTLVAVTPDYVPAKDVLQESVESTDMSSRVSDISEVSVDVSMTLVARCLYARGQPIPLAGLSEFAIQHALPARQFLVLTSSGIYKYEKSRPVDELK